jgi:hypothetical protein
VAVKNNDGPGGVSKGVNIELQREAVAADWKRSAFNGLGQIIVQSTVEPGQIKLTATAEGLEPAVLSLQSVAAQPRPAVK